MTSLLVLLSIVAAEFFDKANADTNASTPYAPYNVTCPSNFNFLRRADGLSSREQQWLENRDKITQKELAEWLSNSQLSEFDAESFLSNGTIRIGLAVSGGGYRSMMVGGGALEALDKRSIGFNQQGPGELSGLLQASTYLAALSGGSWLVSSFVGNNFTTIQELIAGGEIWQFNNLFSPTGVDAVGEIEWWQSIFDDFAAKQAAGFHPTITDVWGRALAAQLLDSDDHGRGQTFSSIQNNTFFADYSMPFPVITTTHRPSNVSEIYLTNTVVEINPYEIGSWDPTLYAFADLQYAGSSALNGEVSQCVNNLDNLGFVLGTSSNVFNNPFSTILQSQFANNTPPVRDLLREIDQLNIDIASWTPNPFNGLSDANSALTASEFLLGDGGENGENIPLQPLIQPSRDVDIIFAFDNSADTDYNWPNGTAIMETYSRQFTSQGNGTVFPYVPGYDTMVKLGLNTRPTFFGVDRSNLTSLFDPSIPEEARHYPPVLVYIPNSQYTFPSDEPTLQLVYSSSERDSTVLNGFEITTRGDGVADSEWRTCAACAVIVREQQRRGQDPSSQCQACFDKYSWNGSI